MEFNAETIGAFMRKFDPQDARAIQLADSSQPDAFMHAVMTAMVNLARGDRELGFVEDPFKIFADGGSDYRARAERLRLAAERPRGEELSQDGLARMADVFGDLALVETILNHIERHESRRALATVSHVFAASTRAFLAWAVISNVTYPEHVTCTGEPLWFVKKLLEVHMSEEAAVASASSRNDTNFAAGRGTCLDDWEDGCGCGAVPVKLSWAVQPGDAIYLVDTPPIDGVVMELLPLHEHLFRTREEALRHREGLLEAWRVGPGALQFRNLAGGVRRHPERIVVVELRCGATPSAPVSGASGSLAG